MKPRKFFIVLGLVAALLTLSWGLGQVSDQAAKPKMRSLTQAQRQAAANRFMEKYKAAIKKGAKLPAIPAPGQQPDLFYVYPNYANTQFPTDALGTNGIHKFVDALPNIPIAVPDTTTYPGSDYYIIALRQYQAKMHVDLPLTTLRGYVQLSAAGTPVAPIQYLGPIILANKDRPVRVKFRNQLPIGTGGDLFIPVDTTYMGAGAGPTGANYKQNRATLHLHGGNTVWISDGTPHQWTTPSGESTPYPKGISVFNVPDMDGGVEPQGTLTFFYSNQHPAGLMFYHDHAYGITRLNVYAGEAAGYLLTDDIETTLINGGTITPPVGTPVVVAAGTLPGLGTPLVIQDKTFVPDNTLPYTNKLGTFASQLQAQDPTWDTTKWGGQGKLWFPHVYIPNQNPADATGANAMGRWDYGPWFWPPFTGIQFGPIPNGYYDPINAPWEPAQTLGTPDSRVISPSGVPESFMDTPLVNGKAYPTLNVPAGLARFRILNACNDRFLNLSLFQATSATNGIVGGLTLTGGGNGYTAVPAVTFTNAPGDTTGRGATAMATVDLTVGSPTYGQVTGFTILSVGSSYTAAPTVTIAPPTAGVTATATATLYIAPTEVGMVPFNSTQNGVTPFPAWWYTVITNGFTFDDRAGGVPDPTYRGPAMVQIGTEGGFLPGPAVIKNQPINYVYNRRDITVGNVNEKALFLGPAERADVVVDFTNFAGKTLILYNDAPAPVPAADPRLDYYTCAPDMTDTGGAPSILPGFGPNTRTVMQIVVGAGGGSAPVDDVNAANLAALQAALPAAFAASHDTIIVPQAPYNAVYSGNFPGSPTAYVGIQATNFTFTPIGGTTPLTVDLYPKAIIEDFQMDYGRMNAILGNEVAHTNNTNQTSIIQAYIDPPVEIMGNSVAGTLVGSLGDGTQLWKITHNGVDTHAIHFHMFHVQLVNRVGWDGALKPPDENELGWKDTVRMNPLEDVVVALRPIAPNNHPFKVPNSVRLLDATKPAGSAMGFTGIDPNGNPVTVTNQMCNFGWEYVYHCHLLGHEENDMMRPMAFAMPPEAPTGLTAAITNGRAVLNWTDNSLNETGFTVQRANDIGFTTSLVSFNVGANVKTYTDGTVGTGTKYYRVYASNVVGSAVLGYPTLTATSTYSNTAQVGVAGPPAAPSNLRATSITRTLVGLAWNDNSSNESNFQIQRSQSPTFSPNVQSNQVGANVTTFNNTTQPNTTYYYRVRARNAQGNSAWSNVIQVKTPA